MHLNSIIGKRVAIGWASELPAHSSKCVERFGFAHRKAHHAQQYQEQYNQFFHFVSPLICEADVAWLRSCDAKASRNYAAPPTSATWVSKDTSGGSRAANKPPKVLRITLLDIWLILTQVQPGGNILALRTSDC